MTVNNRQRMRKVARKRARIHLLIRLKRIAESTAGTDPLVISLAIHRFRIALRSPRLTWREREWIREKLVRLEAKRRNLQARTTSNCSRMQVLTINIAESSGQEPGSLLAEEVHAKDGGMPRLYSWITVTQDLAARHPQAVAADLAVETGLQSTFARRWLRLQFANLWVAFTITEAGVILYATASRLSQALMESVPDSQAENVLVEFAEPIRDVGMGSRELAQPVGALASST